MMCGSDTKSRARGSTRGSFVAAVLFLCAAGGGWASANESLLELGNDAYRRGEYEKAASLYESTKEDDDYHARQFNAGLAWLAAGDREKAIRRFEEASTTRDDDVRWRALRNLGYCQFQRGAEEAGKASEKNEKGELPPENTRLEALRSALQSYRAAVDFYRSARNEGGGGPEDIVVAKTAMKAVLDEIRRIEEERRQREEDEAMRNPSQLLRKLVEKEKLHRRFARSIRDAAGREIRLTSRRLRKAEAENRVLAEKLAQFLRKPPEPAADNPAPNQPGAAPDPSAAGGEESPQEAERRRQAATALDRAVEAQKEAEVAYASLEPGEAVDAHTVAISELRGARALLPIDIPSLVSEAVALQEGILAASRGLEEASSGGLPSETRGSGLGKTLVEALKDKVLRPMAKLLTPVEETELQALSEEEEEVVWATGILSRARLPVPEEDQTPPTGAAGAPAPLPADAIEEINRALETDGSEAHAQATRAKEELVGGAVGEAIRAEEKALEALQRIAELLPKPPLTPEERLRQLIDRERGAIEGMAGLEEIDDQTRARASKELSGSQRAEGGEAEGVASELETRQDARAAKAVPKVREGAEHVYASAEALARVLPREGKEAAELAVRSFEEALALLSGKDQNEESPGEEDERDRGEEPQRDQNPSEPQKDQGAYALTPRQARLLREEMDRKRREEESKLLQIPNSLTVEKDW